MPHDEHGDPRVRMNARMIQLDPFLDTPERVRELDPRLAALLDGGFEDHGGCVVLACFTDSARRTSVAAFGDETGFEAFVNHVHIEDELRGTMESDALRQAVLYARRLCHELTVAYPDDAFEIVVAVSDSCTVRFHKVRSPQSWLAEDIESYEEAVMTLLVSSRR